MERDVEIRRVDGGNVEDLIHLIGELARYEHSTPPDEGAKRRLTADTLAEDPPFTAYLLYLKGRPKGYIIIYTTYSTFDGRRILFIEDLFVLEGERKAGLGKELIKFCIHEAKRQNCCCIEWRVLTWNEDAIAFYEKMGGKRLACFDYEIDEKDFDKALRRKSG